MMSWKNIRTIATFESKVLWRNWFFRIVSIAGIGFLTIFNLAVFSELGTPRWSELSNSWILPYASLLMISIPQAAAVIFLATGLVKKDKKLDTNEVFFVRPISNLDYVLGKALALFQLFFLLNLVLLCIPLLVGLTNPFVALNVRAYLIYPLLTSVPAIVFTTGLSFLLVTVIRNQPISIVLLVGLAGVQLIYYFDQFSNILDFTAFRVPMLASEISGFDDLEFALWQRACYLLTGLAMLFITAFFLDRLAGDRGGHRATLLTGVVLLHAAAFTMVKPWRFHVDAIESRQQMIAANDTWAEVPNVQVLSHRIALAWKGATMESTSTLRIKNNTEGALDTIYFTLNPGLSVDTLLVNNKRLAFHRDLQIVSVTEGIHLRPGEEAIVDMKYHGTINERVAHLEVDQQRYDQDIDFLIFSLPKKYAFLEDDYALLTNDVYWYPDTEIGYNREAAVKGRDAFVYFELSVVVPPGKTPVSQGKVTVSGNRHLFQPEYPLPHLALAIGDYLKKEVVVDSVAYSVFHYPQNDYFLQQLHLLGDTIDHLIADVAREYEDAQKLTYPFKRLQFVEVPITFTAYNKIYQSHQAFVQPEMVLWPEEGGEIRQFDFRRQLKDMNEQAVQNNQVLTDKQKQANVFSDLVRKVFTKQIGMDWVNEGRDFDEPDYCLFPNYYDFNAGVVSKDWALLNRSIATYLRRDKQTQYDYTRDMNGISFAEECNNLMRTTSVTKILTEAEFSKINKSVALKSQYLFSYLGQIIGEDDFQAFLLEWVNTHQHQLTSYEDFREAIRVRFRVDIDPTIRQVFSETAQAAFEISEVQKYEVMDGDRKRYQVLIKVKNRGDSDGVFEVKFNSKEKSDDDDYYNTRVNEEAAAETPARLALVRQGETKLFGFLLDEKPVDLTINTIISQNIPSIIHVPVGMLAKREGGTLLDGERVVDREENPATYEVIVDNEDAGFSHFSPIKPTMLKAWLDEKSVPQKYHGRWSRSYAKWLATTGSDFYGSVIRSAHFTRSGSGDKLVTWTPALREEGFYDLYVFMRGKNQNEYTGNNGEGKRYDYHYIVQHSDGTDHITYNISNAEPGWNYLGSYYFNQTGGSVSLTDECELRTVYADAVKWVKQ